MPFILFQNKKIHYKISGRGNSTVVLLHGFLEDLTMWDELTKELNKLHKIISVDLLGHGKSENISETHYMSLMADAVWAVLKNEKASSTNIIGHSMGGYVALALAQKKDVEVQKIILLNSSALDDSPQKKIDRLRAIKVLEAGKKQFINEAIPNLFAEQNRNKLSKQIEKTKEVALKTSPEGISAALLGMRERSNSIEWINQSKQEIIFMSGEEDGIIPIKSAKEQTQETKSKIIVFKNCGHMAHIESKEECFQSITNALK